MNGRIIWLWVGILAVWLGWGGTAAFASASSAPVPEKGLLRLYEEDDPEGTQRISLDGEWEFYWRQLLAPEELRRGGYDPAYIQVPDSWENEPSAGNGRYGYATYRLRLQVPASDIGKNKALFVRSVGSAYRIWVDGREKPGLGQVGTSRAEEIAQAHINLLFFQVERPTVEIVIQASNYSFREGGIVSEVVYGDTDALIPSILRSLLADLFVIGGFTMIGLYQLVIYAMRRKDRSALYLGIVFLAFAARTFFIDGYLSELLLHIDSWELLVKLEYLSEIVAFLFMSLFVRLLYPDETHRFMVAVAYALSVGLALYVSSTPARVFTDSMMLQSAAKGVVILYFILYVGVRAALHGRIGARINIAAMLALLAALVNDSLYWARILPTVELLNPAVVLFLLSQAVIVSYRYTQLSKRNDTLVEELGTANATLEVKVAERTRELTETNEELVKMKDARNRMLSNIAHDLGSPLAGLQSYLYLMEQDKLPMAPRGVARQLMDKTDYIQRLTRDLFELSKLESGEQRLHAETASAKEWLGEAALEIENDLSRHGFVLRRGDLNALFADGREAFVEIDRLRMRQALQNYVDNAVHFSRGRSDVIELRAFVNEEEDRTPEVIVEIVDYGEGIGEEELPHVFQRFYQSRGGGGRGSGLGLAIVREIMAKHGGTAGVRSRLGEGSVFYIALPAFPS